MKNTAFSILSLALLTACSSELAETANDIVTGDEVQKVTIQSHPFVFDDDTRTLLTASDKSINFSWADYDAMGVFLLHHTPTVRLNVHSASLLVRMPIMLRSTEQDGN